MRVLIDGRMIFATMSGVGRYILGLCRGLLDLGHTASLELWVQQGLPRQHPVWRLAQRGLSIRHVPYPPLTLRSQLGLPFTYRGAHFDLLHYPHFDLPWLTCGKVVITLHDLKYIAHPQFFPSQGQVRARLIHLLASRAVRRAARVMVDSEHTARDAQRLLRASPEKLRLVPLGVDERFFEPLPSGELESIARRYHLRRPYLLFVGERRPHKNLGALLRAYAALRRLTPELISLLVVGRRYGGYSEPEQLTSELGLQDEVDFVEQVEDDDLPALYQMAAAFVSLSLYEGFGLPILEAMAAQTPVVTSGCTSLAEVAGTAAWIVPPDEPQQVAQALYTALYAENERRERVARGVAWARRFTWQRTAALAWQVYQEALATP